MFEVRLETIHDKSFPMALAVENIVQDLISTQTNTLCVSKQTTLKSHDESEQSELLGELLQFMSNETMITCVIDSVGSEHTKFCNHLLIVDGYESFR